MKFAMKKKSVVESRIREIEAEMAALQKNMRTAAKVQRHPLSSAFPEYRQSTREDLPGGGRSTRKDAPVSAARPSDERFKSYLASSFQTHQPLRHERRTVRNKAIAMLIVVAAVLMWLLLYLFGGR